MRRESTTFAAALLLSTVGHAAAFALIAANVRPMSVPAETIFDISLDDSFGSSGESARKAAATEDAGAAAAKPDREEAVQPDVAPKDSTVAEPPKAKPTPKVRYKAEVPRTPGLRDGPDSGGAGTSETTGPARVKGNGATDSGPKTYDAKLLGLSVSYPRYARQHNQAGRVVCRATVDELGGITKSEIVQSSGFPVLDEAAVDALKGARISVNTAGTPTDLLIAFTFRLEG